MKLEGSCHYGKVHFSVESKAPYPFMRCYCSICRKTAGGGGYAINLHGDAQTLKLRGEKHVKVYRVRLDRTAGGRDQPNAARKKSTGRRHFCGECGSALWVYDPEWPDLIQPFASAIDTTLPVPPETVDIMLQSRPNWAEEPKAPADQRFGEYPKESLEAWHRRHGLWDKA
jgi:hypothetical protein